MKVRRPVLSLPGVLTRLAFEALLDQSQPEPFLLDRYEVAYLPSFGLGFDLAQQPKPRKNSKLLIVGYQGEDLTNAATEVEVLRGLFGKRATVLSGATSNKVAVLRELQEPYDYIHFVCHGTYNEESPLSAALHLVPNVQDDSQRVTAGDIMRDVRLPRNPVVTMSACSTALMSSSETNNCHGLTGSLLRAGARDVIGSRWPVYDRTAATCMASFYTKICTGDGYMDPQHCLAEVQRETRASAGIEDFAAFGYMGFP
jgi:CHAT domain-containing protein